MLLGNMNWIVTVREESVGVFFFYLDYFVLVFRCLTGSRSAAVLVFVVLIPKFS
jgi:hypothetical protein